MRRRLDLGASLVGAPRLLLLDEPTTGLDPRSRMALWECHPDPRPMPAPTSCSTTQYLDEADHLADLIVIIDGGRVVAEGTPAELKARTGTDVLELHTATPPGPWHAAAGVLGGSGAGEPSIDAETSRCSLPVPKGAGLLPLAVRALDDAGIDIEDITLRHPTLDEVFLVLDRRNDPERPGRRPERSMTWLRQSSKGPSGLTSQERPAGCRP